MEHHQLHAQGPRPGAQSGRRCTSSCRCMAELSQALTHCRRCSAMPGIVAGHLLLSTVQRLAEVDMVFQFEHVGPPPPREQGEVPPPRLSLVARSGAGRAWPSAAGTLLSGRPTTTSRGSWRASRRRRTPSLGHFFGTRAAPAPRDAARLPARSYRQHERAVRAVDDFRDIESLNHYAERVHAAGRDSGRLRHHAAVSRDETRARRCSGDASPHAGSTTATPWIPVNPNHAEINPAAAVADPDSVFHHYRALIELRGERRSRTATSPCC